MKKTIDYLYRLKQANDEMRNYEAFKLYEAIKELESLQNRSCETCKYGHTYQFDDDVECMKLEADTQGLYFEKDFYCKNWELKK